MRGFGCGLLCELCVGIKGLMKCLLQAGGDRHWGEGQESGCHKGAGIGEGVGRLAWTSSARRSDCDHLIPNTILH